MHRPGAAESELVVFETGDIAAGPVATVVIPFRVASGFHCNYYSADSKPYRETLDREGGTVDAVSVALQARHDAEVARETEILGTALVLLAESGYAAMSMDALAKRARVSKSTIYGRWPGKRPLVVDALRLAGRAGVHTADTGSLRGDLLALGRGFDLSRPRTGGLLLALAHAAQTDADLAAAVAENLGGPFTTAMTQIVDRAIERGEITPAARDLPYLPALLPSLVIARRLLAPDDPVDVDAVVDSILLPLLLGA